MKPLEIKKGIYWVGAVDGNVKHFHGHTYTTKMGTTYNAYLIIDEKIALIDTVYAPFAPEMMARIKEIIPPEKINYIIANHVETDHSGALPEIIKLCPRAKVLGTAKCQEGLFRHYYGKWDFQVVKTFDKLNLGQRNLTFLEAPMLHWPDSMFTYLGEEALLFPNDAFGQHYASSQRFDDEVDTAALMDEAKKYYANILWPLSALVLKKISEIEKMNIPIKMIAPSHGIIWRKDLLKIINAYISWAKNETRPKVVLVYETMWGATEKMARKIAEAVIEQGIELKFFDINQSDRTEIIGEMLDAKGYLIGSSTHNNGMLASIAGFLDFLKGLRPKNRSAAVFGSYGWAGGAVGAIEKILQETGIRVIPPSLAIQYVPDAEALSQCFEFGKNFAFKIKEKE